MLAMSLLVSGRSVARQCRQRCHNRRKLILSYSADMINPP
jgi:hypothetical protein